MRDVPEGRVSLLECGRDGGELGIQLLHRVHHGLRRQLCQVVCRMAQLKIQLGFEKFDLVENC